MKYEGTVDHCKHDEVGLVKDGSDGYVPTNGMVHVDLYTLVIQACWKDGYRIGILVNAQPHSISVVLWYIKIKTGIVKLEEDNVLTQ